MAGCRGHVRITQGNGNLFTLKSSFTEIDKSKWLHIQSPDFPFTDLDFLLALENSACLGQRTGWHPIICLEEDTKKNLYEGAFICFVKSNSYGEYIFDWEWAHAFESHGVPYYPKITAAIPFTPATGPKFLFPPTLAQDRREAFMMSVLAFLAKQKVSSIHHLFIDSAESTFWQRNSYATRSSFQYHWKNQDYKTFDDFLSMLQGKRRRQIKKERFGVQSQNVNVRQAVDSELTRILAQQIFDLYYRTIDKKRGIPYLTEEFFVQCFANLKHRIVLFLAEQDGEIVGMSFSFTKGNKLFGRYWGCSKPIEFLHFELCYYSLIEYSIGKGISLFEAGAQGAHKVQRGFNPVETKSAHYINHAGFRTAIQSFIEEEKRLITKELESYSSHLAYKKNQAKTP